MKQQLKTALVAVVMMAGVQAHAMISDATKNMADAMGAANLDEVTFAEGSTTLSQDLKNQIAQLVTDARAKGQIQNVKVLAWADKEYPMPKVKLADGDVSLAQKRAAAIDKYLHDDLGVSNIDKYNMAERPNKIEQWFKTSDARVKNSAEQNGTAPRTKEETGVFGLKGQASKALILVFLK